MAAHEKGDTKSQKMGGMRAEKCNTDIAITDSQKQGLNTWDIRGGVYQSSVTMGKRQGEIIGC